MVYGNSTTRTVQYDARYRPSENKLTGASGTLADFTYQEDATGNITQIHDALDATYNRDFTYDDLNRLVTANTGTALWNSLTFTYDAMGNMLDRRAVRPYDHGGRGDGGGPSERVEETTFSYVGTTSKLASVSSTGAVNYDAAGNETHAGKSSTYSPRNLMASAERAGSGVQDTPPPPIAYGYDGRGIRVSRNDGLTITHFHYSPEFHLLSFGTPGGTPLEIVWFGDLPVAQMESGQPLRYTFSDHLGTPIIQTDASGTVVWRAEYEPYGRIWAMRVGSTASQPLRLPGQEDNGDLYYNIFRWYRPEWGRYVSVDAAFPKVEHTEGWATYSYVRDQPLKLIDGSGRQDDDATTNGLEVRDCDDLTCPPQSYDPDDPMLVALDVEARAEKALSAVTSSIQTFLNLVDPTPLSAGIAAIGHLTGPRFTRYNFRDNLAELSGERPADSDAHHMFPQEFEDQFRELGIDIHDPQYGSWWQSAEHRSLAKEYNDRWRSFLNENPTAAEVFEFGKTLAGEYELKIFY